MSVTVNSTRKAVEIAWDPNGSAEPPSETPPGFPTHPIYLPPYVDNAPPTDQPYPDQGLPGDQPRPDQGLPEEQPHPDQGLPGDQPRPDQGLPGDQPRPDQGLPGDQPRPDQGLPGDQPRPDQGLPGEQPGVEHPIYLPPYVDNSLPGEVAQKIREFLHGNLPPSVQPTHDTAVAVQVFAQGQEGDWSNTAVMKNDGLAVLTFPEDFSGESYVEVRDLAGNLVDSGTIVVEADV